MGITKIFLEIDFPLVKIVENLKKKMHIRYTISVSIRQKFDDHQGLTFWIVAYKISSKATAMLVSQTNPGGGGLEFFFRGSEWGGGGSACRLFVKIFDLCRLPLNPS